MGTKQRQSESVSAKALEAPWRLTSKRNPNHPNWSPPPAWKPPGPYGYQVATLYPSGAQELHSGYKVATQGYQVATHLKNS